MLCHDGDVQGYPPIKRRPVNPSKHKQSYISFIKFHSASESVISWYPVLVISLNDSFVYVSFNYVIFAERKIINAGTDESGI